MSHSFDGRHSRKIEYWIFLACIMAVGICYHGIRAGAVYGLTAVTAILTDFICLFLEKKSYKLADTANLGMALTMSMMFPATVPYSIVILSTVFAVAIGSHVFGYKKGYLFPPPAIGYLFALSCWKGELLQFPPTGEPLPLFHYQAQLSPSFSYLLLTEHEMHESWNHILMGMVHSPMGTGCIFLLLVGVVVLLFRKQLSLWACLGYLLGISISSFFMVLPIYHTFVSCMILFSMIFLVADPAVMPCKSIMAYVGALITALLSCYLIAFHHMEYAPIVAVMLSVPLWQWLSKVEQRLLPEPIEEDFEEIPVENKFADDSDELEEPDEIDETETFDEDDFDEEEYDEDDFDDEDSPTQQEEYDEDDFEDEEDDS